MRAELPENTFGGMRVLQLQVNRLVCCRAHGGVSVIGWDGCRGVSEVGHAILDAWMLVFGVEMGFCEC